MKLNSLLGLLVLPALVASCGRNTFDIQQRSLAQRNPTSYEFPFPVETIKEAINQARGESWHDAQAANEGAELAWRNERNPFTKGLLEKKGNQSDAFLYGMGDAVGTSLVYQKNGRPLTYYADFQIHLVPITPSKTRVEIITHDPRVKAGTEWHPFARSAIYVSVAPTSIEEYQILLDVGAQLGIKDMAKLIVPQPGIPARALKSKRWHRK